MMHRTLILSVLALAGCASSSGVIPAGDGIYMVAKSAPAASGGELTADLYREATAYCAPKQVSTVEIKSRDGVPFVQGNAQLRFRCIDK